MKPTETRIAIVGAGIAGLTAAIAARRFGFRVELFEQAGEFRNLSGGIALHSNGQRVLAALGLLNSLEPYLRSTQIIRIERVGGGILSEFDYGSLLIPFNRSAIILRHKLHLHLLQAAAQLGVSVHFGHRAETLARTEPGMRISFASGGTVDAPIVIGADGVHSSVRKASGMPFRILSPREAYLRGASNASADDAFIHELWSPDGMRFGYAPLPEGQTYFYCSAPFGRWTPSDSGVLQRWLDSWSHFSPVVTRLLDAVSDWGAVNYSEIAEIEMDRWTGAPLFLIGDAAHAMTPNLGQGANSAMVDALVLVRLLAEENSLAAVDQRYHDLRFRFVRKIQRASRRVGAFAGTKNPFARRVGDAALHFLNAFPQLTLRQRYLSAGWNPAENSFLSGL